MTYLFNNKIDFIDQNVDATARLRISSPLTMFEHSNQYGTNQFKFDKATAGTGTITEPSAITTSATILSTGGTASGAQAVRATRAYIHYAVGKSLFVGTAFSFGVGATGCSQRVGYFDANNGIFLQQVGTALSIVIRSNSSGSPVDVVVPQASWNIDKMDGTGPSGITFANTASQNIRFDMLGSTSIRCYMYGNGRYWLFHQLENQGAASPAAPSPVTPNLTVRAEVINTATASAICTMTVTNQSVTAEGAEELFYSATFSGGNGVTTITPSGRRPICTLRASTTGPGRLYRNYGQIVPQGLNLYTAGAFLAEIVFNGTLTGAAFSPVNTLSLAEMDTSATAISGGITVYTEYITASGGQGSNTQGSQIAELGLQFPIVYSSLSNTQDSLSLVITPIGTGAASAGNFLWAELW